jgi:hypothetical protein
MTSVSHLHHVEIVWIRDYGNDENRLIRLNLVQSHVKDIDVVASGQRRTRSSRVIGEVARQASAAADHRRLEVASGPAARSQ